MSSFKRRLFLPFLLLAASLACSAATKFLPPAVTILVAPAESATWDAASLQQASEIIAARLEERAAGQFDVQVTGENRISVMLSDAKDLPMAQKSISEVGVVSFVDTQQVYFVGQEIGSKERVILTQADVQSALAQESQAGQYEVSFALNPDGTRKMADYTHENVGHFLAIVRDGRIVSCPRINGAILGGEGIISGTFTRQEAEELAALLSHPPLPFPLVLVEVKKP
jgi:preprotein translocase subunit SecD